MHGDNQGKKAKITLKRAVIYILIAAVILFPTILAIASISYSGKNNTDIEMKASSVVLYNSSGVELYRENEDERTGKDESLINIFNTIYANMEPTDTIPEDALRANVIKVEMVFKDVTHTLTCYFVPESGLSYCKNQAGASFKIPLEDSDRFLRSDFSEPIYLNATPPTLKSFRGEVILPSSLSWYYRNIDGTYALAKKAAVQGTDKLYEMSGGIAFEFETQPDTATARVFENGIMVFNNSIDKLETLVLKSDTTVDVSITATWKKADSRAYYGDTSYSFSVSIGNRAEFSIDKSKISQGEFAILTAKNITYPSRIKFTSNIPDFIPRSISQGETLYMIIPRTELPESSTKFECSVVYGVSTQAFSLELDTVSADATPKKFHDSMSILDLSMQTDGASSSQNLFLYSKKHTPEPELYEKAHAFGDSVYYEGNNMLCPFDEYSSKLGNQYVKAVCSAKVVLIGESATMGKYAVADLGLGLRVWYCNLSTVNVEAGEYITAGKVIGTTGALLSGNGEGFSIMVTCNGTPINPNSLFFE